MSFSEESVIIKFVGDIMCQQEQIVQIGKDDTEWDKIFSSVSSCLKDSDLVIGNLETPVASERFGHSKSSTVFCAPVGFVRAIKKAGIGVVSTANNHCLDRGVRGLEETIRHLDEEGLMHFGTYKSKTESDNVFLCTVKGVRIAFVGCTYGTNSESGTEILPLDGQWMVDMTRPQELRSRTCWDRLRHMVGMLVPKSVKAVVNVIISVIHGQTPQSPDCIMDNVSPLSVKDSLSSPQMARIEAKILDAKRSADIVVVMPHCGGQYNPGPGFYQKELIDRIQQVGADLIVSGHSHTPLGCKKYKNGAFAVYSLGNFIFTPKTGWYINNVFADYGVILTVVINVIDKKISNIDFTITKSIIDGGISKVVAVEELIENATSLEEKEKLLVDKVAIEERIAAWKLQ